MDKEHKKVTKTEVTKEESRAGSLGYGGREIPEELKKDEKKENDE